MFAAIETLEPDDLVRGQFEGYRNEPGVAPDSDVETFAAVPPAHRLVALGRRAVVRPGRARSCPCTCTEVRVELHRPPPNVFSEFEQLPYEHATTSASGSTREISIAIGVRVKVPGEGFHGENVELYLCNDHPGRDVGRTSGCSATRCDGEGLLFAREDGVEAAWRVVDNVLVDHGPAFPYHRQSWGPEEQYRLLEDPEEVWHEPMADS